MKGYDKLIYLQNLALDLEDNETAKLASKNLELLLALESKLEPTREDKANRRVFLEARANIERQSHHKARIVNKRYLSSGELEIEFISKAGETFTKLYEPDSYEYQRNLKWENIEKEKLARQVDMTAIDTRKSLLSNQRQAISIRKATLL